MDQSEKIPLAFAFPPSFEQHGYCISCFSMENKHKMITRKTTLIQNTTTFEASAMQEVVTDELQVLKEPDSLGVGIKLLGSRKIGKKKINIAVQLWPLANVGTLGIASSAKCQDGTIHIGDAVLYSGAGRLCAYGYVSSMYQYGSALPCWKTIAFLPFGPICKLYCCPPS